MSSAARLSITAIVILPLLVGCRRSNTAPRVYTTAASGAASAEALIDDFKKAHAAGDPDAAMRLFYWESADNQDVFWVHLNTLFAEPLGDVELSAPKEEHETVAPLPKTMIPVVAGLQITKQTSPTSHEVNWLMIGESANGFYFVPPINSPPTTKEPPATVKSE